MTFELLNGTVRLGNWTVFDGLSITVAEGEIVSILGPSGCGKTTLLRACCGLELLEQGERRLGGILLPNNTIVPEITMLFQQPVLYPHLNVSQNIGLGAGKTVSKKDLQSRVDTVLKAVGLEGFNLRGTAGLSGGEAQRVAFGRALLQEPEVILLDEPFASVDVERRMALAKMTRVHLKDRNITTVHVTHDQEEAKVLSDRIIEWKDLVGSTNEEGYDGKE
ncbi:MAG: ABC transporter ATP-binding protein [Poseidonia sp.]